MQLVGGDDSAREETPLRTCAGCRSQDDRDALLRLSLAGDPPRIAPDPKRALGGRGVSVHPRRACLRGAARGGIARTLKRAVDVDEAELVSLVRGHFARRVDGLLLSARRAGKAVLGTDAVRAYLAQGPERPLVVLARDAAGRREEITQAVVRAGGACVEHLPKEELGKLFGREALSVLAITDRGIASSVRHAAGCVAELSEAA